MITASYGSTVKINPSQQFNREPLMMSLPKRETVLTVIPMKKNYINRKIFITNKYKSAE